MAQEEGLFALEVRILFLSARVGVGHTAAAQAVRAALTSLDAGIETETIDSYRYAASIFAKVVADGYILMVKTVPQVYGYFYDRVERATHIPAFRAWINTYTAANLRSLIERRKPDVVVCTHAFPCGVMAEYKRKIDPTLPVMGIVTDFAVHPFWIYRNIDAYAVATREMGNMLVSRGVERERILLSGIPVDSRFGRPRLSQAELRQQLALPQDRRVVLLMAGGLGIGPLELMMRALDRLVEIPVSAVVIVGCNAGLEQRVRSASDRVAYPLRVHGFVDNVFDYMHAGDLLLSKPGGLTASEALVAELPMVLVKPLPGQEERNARYLVAAQAAIFARSEQDLTSTMASLLRSPQRLASLRARMREERRPDAAIHIARRILMLAQRQ